jgi:hypothetical protein
MNSKFSYVACGVSGMATFICALCHLGVFVILNGIFTFWNWHTAELRRKEEEYVLLEQFQSLQQGENKPNE